MFTKLALAAALALPLSLAGQAQETYTIKVKKQTQGLSTHRVKNTSSVESTKVIDGKGAVAQDIKRTLSTFEIYDETVVEKLDAKKKATKLKRFYEKAQLTTDNVDRVFPYQGKTVVIEKKDGKFWFRYDSGAEITGDDAQQLDQEFNKDSNDSEFSLEDYVLPAKAVAVGESWTIAMAKIVAEFQRITPIAIDEGKATGTGKLLKAYKKDGRQFGDFHFKLEMPPLTFKIPAGDFKLQPGATLVLDVKLSTCIDGSTLHDSPTITIDFNATALVAKSDSHLAISKKSVGSGTVTELTKTK